jgi:hypothetical protein
VCFLIVGLLFSLCLTPRVFGQVDQAYEFADEENPPPAAEHLAPQRVGPRYTDRGRILGEIKLTLDGDREPVPRPNVNPRISDYRRSLVSTGDPLERFESRFEEASAYPVIDLSPSRYTYTPPPPELSEIGRDVGLTARDAVEDSTDDDDEPQDIDDPGGFRWRPAINQSLMLLGIQHGYALVAQEKTRSAVANGNFFGDYWRSVKGLRGWDDGNKFFTNYIAHPMQGGLTGFIYVQNSPRAMRQKFGDSREYWNDRFKALLWSAAWSTQFELGPISQSSIGNVGLYGGMGYVDLVVTPTLGTAWLVTEEAVDRYWIRHWERKGFIMRILLRTFLNPMRSVANLFRFKEPWYRDRGMGW